MRDKLLFIFCATSVAACGAPEAPKLPELEASADGPVCEAPRGTYKATFILRETEGDCDAAKAESHDPISFTREGEFISPAEGLVACDTAHAGCQLAVRCATSAFDSANASLDATLSPDGTQLQGVAVVEGTYKGCQRVVYDVVAVQDAATR